MLHIICSRCSDSVSHKIYFMTYSHHRDHPPAWELITENVFKLRLQTFLILRGAWIQFSAFLCQKSIFKMFLNNLQVRAYGLMSELGIQNMQNIRSGSVQNQELIYLNEAEETFTNSGIYDMTKLLQKKYQDLRLFIYIQLAQQTSLLGQSDLKWAIKG